MNIFAKEGSASAYNEEVRPGTPTDIQSTGEMKKVSTWATQKLFFLPCVSGRLPAPGQRDLSGSPCETPSPAEHAGFLFVSGEAVSDIRLEASNLLVAIRDHDPNMDEWARSDIDLILLHLERSMRKIPIREVS